MVSGGGPRREGRMEGRCAQEGARCKTFKYGDEGREAHRDDVKRWVDGCSVAQLPCRLMGFALPLCAGWDTSPFVRFRNTACKSGSGLVHR